MICLTDHTDRPFCRKLVSVHGSRRFRQEGLSVTCLRMNPSFPRKVCGRTDFASKAQATSVVTRALSVGLVDKSF